MQQMCGIDEMSVPFKGSSILKHYIPSKPHKWGFNIFLCAISLVYCMTSMLMMDP